MSTCLEETTLNWKDRMEDDDLLTDENIDATNQVLVTYINSLRTLENNPS